MEANELMIGDFVRRTFDGTICKVIGIDMWLSQNDSVTVSLFPFKTARMHQIEDIEPIEITEEFLLENGFETKQNGLFILKEKGIYLRKSALSTKGSTKWLIEIGNNLTINGYVQHVHKLQQMARMAEIEDFADNLKFSSTL